MTPGADNHTHGPRKVIGSKQIERIGPGDLTELVSDVGPVPLHVGAVLFLAETDIDTPDPATVRSVLAERLVRIGRLRQRLIEPGCGLGRPYWFDDAHFDLEAHLSQVRCPAPGDREAVLSLALDALTWLLPRTRPSWRAIVVTDIADPHGRVAVVMVLHHVLADGIGGLAILAHLVDGPHTTAPTDDPVSISERPRNRELFVDNLTERLRMLRHLPWTLARIPAAWAELGRGTGGRAPRCSFNAPTGARRAVSTAEMELETLRRVGRCGAATVNDVLLVAVSGALATVLRRRGERPSELVISVPVSARSAAAGGQLGNQVGVMPVRVPLVGTPTQRLVAVAHRTRLQKATVRGGSAAVMGPWFRALAATGMFRWFIDRQRLVNSFLSDLPGPPTPLTIAHAPVTSIMPLIVSTGNIAVAFVALSYAGTLTVTIMVDPDLVPDLEELTTALHEQFHHLADAADPTAP
ncbi:MULTISPECIES: wax ester/triacylglycerol synthase domain-containing protein [Rhodococcus]|uniref:wax ester/triacylglycerol synthase domain-containing protein n=1 Tax=Rhodococcus TaxID=1827 RepID=UPI001E639FA2|nr:MULTISPECIES: wax ester/triacylglycerol synthase domain-containing protein [Rhodococcus]BDB60699.1 diacylglycerol O-acyltransferase [Rhodococcus sp. RDE2]